MANREIRIRGNNKVSSVRQDSRKIGKQLQNQERLCSPRGVAPGYGGTRFANRGKQSQHQETLFPRGVVAMVWGNKQRKQESNITDKKSEISYKKWQKLSLGSNYVGLGTSGGALASTWRTGYGFFEILVDFRAQMVSLWVTISHQFPDWGHQKRTICVFGSRY